MKMIKRTFAILLTIIMLASMVVMPVNAAQEFSFTMTNCKEGFVYTVYKLATYNPNTGAYSNIADGMETIITEFKEGTTKIYNEEVLEACNNLSDEVLEDCVAYTVVSDDLTNGTYTQVCQPGVYFVKATSGPEGYVEVNNSVFQLPYYEVDQDANTSVQINTITFSAGAKVFDYSQDVVKEITNSDVKGRTDISTAKIGDVVQYRITGSILGSSDQHLKYYALADTMEDSLTFVNNGESVTLPTQATTSEEDTTAPSDDETTADETSPSSDETDSNETDPDETSDSSSKESEDTTAQDEDAVSYALVGYINGKNDGCDDDVASVNYVFTDGTLTMTFEQESYVFVKETDNTDFYMFESYTTATSGVLSNTSTGASEKMYVPAGEVTFTLTDNGDGTLTLSYVVNSQASSSSSQQETVVSFYAVNSIGWNSVNAHAWSDTGSTTWPGTAMSKTGKIAANGAEVYQIAFTTNYTSVIFNDGTNQLNETSIQNGKYYDLATLTWYDSLSDIPSTTVALAGSFNSWDSTANVFVDDSDTPYISTVKVSLDANSTYGFKVVEGTTWLSCATPITTSVSGLTFSEGISSNATITTTDAGEYTFTYNKYTNKLSVVYPGATSSTAGFALFGYINGVDEGCEADYLDASIVFDADNTLVYTFTEESFVAVKKTDNSAWYYSSVYTEDASATFFNDATYSEKMRVPAGTYKFTLVENTNSSVTLSYVESEPTSESTTESTTVEEEEKQFALVGYINGANVDVEEDQSLAQYPFEDGTLTVNIESNSYVHVKTTDGTINYMFDNYTTASSGILKDTSTGANEKMYVPAGNVTFTVTENSDGTLTLSYTVEEAVTTSATTTQAPTLSNSYYLVGVFNDTNVGCDANTDRSDFLFSSSNSSFTVTLTGDSYVAVRNDSTDVFYRTSAYTDTTQSAVLQAYTTDIYSGGGSWLYVPSGEVTFTLVENSDGTLTLSYTIAGEEESSSSEETTVAEAKDYALVGYINGANVDIEDDQTLAEYPFVDGTLTVDVESDSYVHVRTTDGDTDGIYYFDEYVKAPTGTLYNSSTGAVEKMYVPAGKVTFILTENEGGTLTLSYTVKAVETETTTQATTATEATTAEVTQDTTAAETSATTLYFTPSSDWASAGARFAAYVFNSAGDSAWASLTDADGDGVYECTLPSGYTWESVIFCRMDPANTTNDWSAKWNQTADLTIPSDSNHFTVNSGEWDGATGTWSVYTPVEDSTDDTTEDQYPSKTVYFLPGSDWEMADAWFAAYIYGSGGNAWVEFTDEDGDGYYKAVTPANIGDNMIFVRMNPANTIDDGWNGKWNQSSSESYIEKIDAGTNCFKITDPWKESNTGEWIEYTPSVTVYLNPDTANNDSDWILDGARFAAYFWKGEENAWLDLTDEDGDGVYQVTVLEGQYENVIFCRMDPATTENSWDNKWNQTNDQTSFEDNITAGNNCFYISDPWNTSSTGYWTSYTPASIAGVSMLSDLDDTTYSNVYFVNYEGWEKVYAYAYNSETDYAASWPGVAMTATQTTVLNGSLIYKFTVSDNYTNIIFNDGEDNQTADLEIMAGQYYDIYSEQWYESISDIPEAEYTLVGYINGANVGCEDDYQGTGYEFSNGKVTVQLDQSSWVYVKTQNNKYYYMFETYCEYSSGDIALGNTEKMYVPEGNVTFTLVENGNGTLTLSYPGSNVQEEEETDLYQGTEETTVETDADTYSVSSYAISLMSDDYGIATASEEYNTVYFINSGNWSTVYAYYWTGSSGPVSWPGVAMTNTGTTAPNGSTIYSISVPSTYDKIIFNNNSSQTSDLTLQAGQYYDLVTNTWYSNLSDVPSSTTEYTVYFVNSENWPRVYAHHWADSTDATTWPGELMTSTGETAPNGATIYSLTFTSDHGNIIFNNGSGTQTADLIVYNNQYYDYITEKWYDSADSIPTTGSALSFYLVASGAAANFTNVYAHVWNTAGAQTTWPGKKMTDTGETTSEGYTVFKVSFTTADYTSVIFNDNYGTQSSEATIQNGKYYDYSSGIWYDSLEDIGKIAGEFYLVGGLNSWTPTDEYKFTSNGDGTSNVYLTVTLEAGEYKFKIQNGSNMYGYDGYVINSDQTVTLSTYAGNATLKPPVSGEITLTFNKENAQLTVDMPEVEVDPESMVDVYYTNFDNWDEVYVYNYDYDTDTSPVQWPGTKMEVLTDGNGDPVLCNNGATIYHAQISNQYSTVIFNNNAGTESEKMTMVENGYYDKWSDQWYTSKEDIPAKEYYLVGTIDGTEYTSAHYKFSDDGILTLETSQNSYVYVKNKFDTYIYKFAIYTETTSGVLSTGYSVSGHPMVIPAGVATINLTENSNGSLTLSYSVGLPNIVVRLDDDVLLTEGVHYTIVEDYKFDTQGKENATFAIVLTADVLNETQEVAPGKTIYDFNEISVDYMAILNQNAEIGEPGNKNLVTLDYTRTSSLLASDTNETPSPEEDDPDNPTGVNEVDGNKTTVYTFELVINKIDAGKLSPLEGAEFKLYSDAGATNVVVVNGKEQVATSDANGVLSFVGLGSGTYYLKETKAPYMYLVNNTVYKFVIKADAPVGQLATQTSNGAKFVFDNDGTFETSITNLSAFLPITGAAGIAMVILGGLMLVFISLVLYKSKKKKVSKA